MGGLITGPHRIVTTGDTTIPDLVSQPEFIFTPLARCNNKKQLMVVRIAPVSLILALLAFSQGIAKELRYTVDLRDTKQHLVHVTLLPSGFSAKQAIFQMPVWAPGAYSVSHYGRYVKNFRAFDKAKHELTVVQENSDRWSIASGKSVTSIEYDVLDSHKDSTSLYFAMAEMDTAIFFANATALFGYYDDDKNAPATVRYVKPADWKLSCALPPFKKGYSADTNATFQNTEFYANDYDALADAPVMASPSLATKSFREGKAVYDVAVASNADFAGAKLDSLVWYLRKIVRAETDFFHDTPFDHYTFLLNAPSLDHMPSMAQGALEHANSSDYLLANFNWSLFKRAFLSIFSHEFFHLWNVKRIHSSLLGPFDYTKRVETTSLWLAEGVTEYYAHTLLVRYGIISPSEFYDQIGEFLRAMQQTSEEAKTKSLEQLSIDESDFHLDNAELFYIKGPLVGLMLDLEIRSRTGNKKSLDDVMLALNNDAKSAAADKTFKDEELIHKVEQIAGVDLTDFYNRYIHGTDSLPIDRYFAMMGVSHAQKSGGSAQLGMTAAGQLMVASIDSNSTFGRAGIKQGDILLAVNGTKITLDNVEMISAMKDSLTSATISIQRGGQTMDVTVNFTSKSDSHHKKEGAMEVDLDAPASSAMMRNGIMGH
jgi:predicted metalloprotease with PDZ domain